MNNMIDKEIELINNIIFESVIHGGDAGGAYFSNPKYLERSINNWLKFRKLDMDYEVKTTYKMKGIEFDTIPEIIKKEIKYE